MTQSGIEPATFRFVAQHLNHCATAVPIKETVQYMYIIQYVKLSHCFYKEISFLSIKIDYNIIFWNIEYEYCKIRSIIAVSLVKVITP